MNHYQIHRLKNIDINEYYEIKVAEILVEEYIFPLFYDYIENPSIFKEFDDDVKAWVKAGKPDDWDFK